MLLQWKALTVWLVKPEAPQDAESVAVMRRAIEKEGPRGSLIVMPRCARARGLSGERPSVSRLQRFCGLRKHMNAYIPERHRPFLESVPARRHGAQAPHIAEHVRWLVRSAVDLALRLERAAANSRAFALAATRN